MGRRSATGVMLTQFSGKSENIDEVETPTHECQLKRQKS